MKSITTSRLIIKDKNLLNSSPTVYYTPNILNRASFESGYNGMHAFGTLGTPSWASPSTGSRTTVHAYVSGSDSPGSHSIQRAIVDTGWTIISASNASPTVIYALNHRISNGAVGIYGNTDTNLNRDYYTPSPSAIYASVIDSNNFSLWFDSGHTQPVSSSGGTGGTCFQSDLGGGIDCAFYDAVWGFPVVTGCNRLWTRFAFYIDAAFDGVLKFHQLYGANSYSPQFSGLYFGAPTVGHLCVNFTPETDGVTGAIQGDIVALSSIVNQWNTFEMDYWRNGDTSNGGNDYPSVAMWLNDVQITSFLNGYPHSPASWINGRLNFGTRASSEYIGAAHWLGILNRAVNTVKGNIWIDEVSVSSLGRIGP